MIKELLKKHNRKLNVKKFRFCVLSFLIIIITIVSAILIGTKYYDEEIKEDVKIQSSLVIKVDSPMIYDAINMGEMIIPRMEYLASSIWVEVEIEEINRLETPLTQKELTILHKIVEAEATDGTISDKVNVANVIINRVLTEEFPDDVKSVVFQKKQFSPIKDGRYYDVNVTTETMESVEIALTNEDTTNGALYFCNYSKVKNSSYRSWFNSLEYIFTDDIGHSYYK